MYSVYSFNLDFPITMDSIFKQYSLTGNAYVDGFIIANIVPILISYCNNIMRFATTLLQFMYDFFIGLLKRNLESRIIGNVVGTFVVNEEDYLFDFILNHIFT